MSKKPSAVEIQLLSGRRQSTETDTAVTCCNDWLRLGVSRSVPKLIAHYQKLSDSIQEFTPPSMSVKSMGTWSSKFNWAERAAEFDAAWEAQKEIERKAVMAEGLALDYERTRKLLRLADFLEGQIYERGKTLDGSAGPFHNVWVPDVKSIGTGEFAERVDIERFNAPLLSEFRATLDDIAKEVGGRIKKQHIDLDVDVSKLTDEELERIINSKG